MSAWYQDKQGRFYKRISEIDIDNMAHFSYPVFKLPEEALPVNTTGSVLMSLNYLIECKGE